MGTRRYESCCWQDDGEPRLPEACAALHHTRLHHLWHYRYLFAHALGFTTSIREHGSLKPGVGGSRWCTPCGWYREGREMRISAGLERREWSWWSCYREHVHGHFSLNASGNIPHLAWAILSDARFPLF